MRLTFWIPKAARTQSEYVIFMLFRDNSSYANTQRYYIICTVPVLSRYESKTITRAEMAQSVQ